MAYPTSRNPAIVYSILFARVENIIIYIPEEEATCGDTPKLRSSGLKMTPPPEPTVPAIRPAPTAPIINWTSNLGVQCKSPSTNWYPCSTLRWCSLLIRKMLDAVMQTINKINSIIRTKSKAEQDSIPITESMFEFPRNRLIEMRTKKREGIITRLAGFR